MTSVKDHRNLQFENVWGKDVSSYREGVLQMWKCYGGPVGNEAEQRLGQLVFVVCDNAGALVGVSTAFKAYVKQLRNHFFIFRLMIMPEYRIPDLTSRLLVSTRDFLESMHDQETAEPAIGLLTLVQREQIKKIRNEAIWPASRMVYIGNTAEGHHIRVYYFKGARIVA